ncbi:MAG: DUF998 domain-containing protein [Candidatus Hodarchaeota archaeon]
MKSINNVKNNLSKTISKRWAISAISGFFLFGFILISMHFIHPEFNPINRFMSEFILGQHGWIMNIAYTGNFIGFFSLIIAIYHSYSPPVRSWAALISLGIAVICILSNYFPVDIYGKATTISGYIHNLGGFVGSIAGLTFMFLFYKRLKVYGLLSGKYHILIMLAISATILFLGLLFFFEQISGFIGVIQRVYVAILIAYFITVSNGIKSGAITQRKI